MTSEANEQLVLLDLNNPVFQRSLFQLAKNDQRSVLNTLRKISRMTWPQVYANQGLKWELIFSKKGPAGSRLYIFRIGKGFRGVAFREEEFLRILSLHPDHDSAYKHN